MDPGEVASFVERAREAIADAPEMGARNTQLRVVEPFLSTLGWDVRSAAVEAAYSTSNGTVVDYALCPGDRPRAFVAVAACGDDLTVAGRDELLEAMRASGVERGAYTNGRRFLLLALDDERSADDPDGSGDGTADSAAGVEQVELALADLPEHVAALSALHRETLAGLDADARREAAAALVDDGDATAAAVTDAVVDAAGDALPAATLRETVDPLARRFLDAVVDELAPTADLEALQNANAPTDAPGSTTGDETDADGNEVSKSTNDGEGAGGSAAETPADPGTETGEDVVGDGASEGPGRGSGSVTTLAEREAARDAGESESEYVMRFFEDGRSVGAVGNPDPASAVAQGVQYLLDERGLGPRLRFPYAPEHDDLAFLHREPVHPDGRAMSTAIDLGGLYVCMDEELDALQERVATLAERTGLGVMFSGDWPEPDV